MNQIELSHSGSKQHLLPSFWAWSLGLPQLSLPKIKLCPEVEGTVLTCFIKALSSEVSPVYKVELQVFDSHTEMELKMAYCYICGLVLAVAFGSAFLDSVTEVVIAFCHHPSRKFSYALLI